MADLSPLLTASEAFLRDLDAQGDAATRLMLKHYDPVQRRLLESLDKLQAQIGELESPTKAQLYRLDRYQSLLQQVNTEMGRMGQLLGDQLPGLTDDAGQVGMQAAEELVRLQANSAGIAAAFNKMSVANVQRAVSFVSPESPLTQMLVGRYGESWAEVIASQYVTGVALGQSPRVVIRNLKQTVTVAGPADLDRIIRTAQIWTYRQTNHVAWQRSGVVAGWIWSATLDTTTCGSCWAMNGTKHDVSETLDDHHRGRCAPIPQVVSSSDYQVEPLDIPSGEEVFSRYSRGQQESIAKAGGWLPQYRAWQDGAMAFSDMTRVQTDSIYGDMRSLRPLVSILGSDAEQYYS
jgi:hypothetical protein